MKLYELTSVITFSKPSHVFQTPFLQDCLSHTVNLCFNIKYDECSFRTYHSTETTLEKVTNKVFKASNSGQISVLVLLDLCAALNSVDYIIFKPFLPILQFNQLVKLQKCLKDISCF